MKDYLDYSLSEEDRRLCDGVTVNKPQWYPLFKQGVFIFPNTMPQGGGYAIAIFKKNHILCDNKTNPNQFQILWKKS
jgi:hypothetical protein